MTRKRYDEDFKKTVSKDLQLMKSQLQKSR